MNIIMVALSRYCCRPTLQCDKSRSVPVSYCRTSQPVVTVTDTEDAHVQYSHSIWNDNLNRKVLSSQRKAPI